jgi:hypothetical protein
MAQLPTIHRRSTLVSVTSLRSLHRLTLCSVVLSLVSLGLLLWRLP